MKILCQKFSPPPPPPPSACFSSDKFLSAIYLSSPRSVHGKLIVPPDTSLNLLSLLVFRMSHVPHYHPLTPPPHPCTFVCTQVVCNRRSNKQKRPCEFASIPSGQLPESHDHPRTFVPLKSHKRTSNYWVRLQAHGHRVSAGIVIKNRDE